MTLLEVRGIERTFGGVRALHDVSIDVSEGSVIGLIGPNGAGKTTLFNVISGLLAAHAGKVSFDGREISHLPAHGRAALGIARSFQNLGLMADETAAYNVLSALHRSAGYAGSDPILRPWRSRSAERRLAARADAALSTFGVIAERDRAVRDLSFAKARFVELAAITAEEPRLMLLDEPTTGLDLAETSTLASVLRELRARGTAVLLVAHDVAFVMQVCDELYVLAQGQVLFHGPPAAAQRDARVIEAYLGTAA